MKNLMKIGGLSECRVVAGALGMDKEVNLVTIMEVPDIVRWLKGNELILTSFYPIKENEKAQFDLVRQLHESGATALAIKPHRYVEEIPKVLLEEAETYQFPIIEIPESISYLDILEPVMNVIFDNKVVLQKDIEQAYQLLNEISISAQGVHRLIETLSYLTNNVVTVESHLAYIELPSVDFIFKELNAYQAKELALVKRPIRMKRIKNDQEIDCIVAPILIDGRVFGTITSWGGNTEHFEMDLAILERASMLLTVEFLRLKVKNDIELQYKQEFIRDLLLSENMKADDLKERGVRYNFFTEDQYVCLALSMEPHHDETRDNIDPILHRIDPDLVVGQIRQLICILLKVRETNRGFIKKEVVKLHEQLMKHLGENTTVKIGIGGYYEGLLGLRESFNEAERAVTLGGRTRKKECIVHYQDLGIYRLVAQIQDQNELYHFYEETVGKLVMKDRRSDLSLMETLRAFFEYDEKLVDISQALFIHVNTLKYRLQKINKITGYSLSQSEGKLMLQIGLKIYDILQSDYRFK